MRVILFILILIIIYVAAAYIDAQRRRRNQELIKPMRGGNDDDIIKPKFAENPVEPAIQMVENIIQPDRNHEHEHKHEKEIVEAPIIKIEHKLEQKQERKVPTSSIVRYIITKGKPSKINSTDPLYVYVTNKTAFKTLSFIRKAIPGTKDLTKLTENVPDHGTNTIYLCLGVRNREWSKTELYIKELKLTMSDYIAKLFGESRAAIVIAQVPKNYDYGKLFKICKNLGLDIKTDTLQSGESLLTLRRGT